MINKLFTTILLVLGCLMVSCNTIVDKMQITGKVRNIEGDAIVYYQTVDGMYNPLLCDTLRINSDSTYQLVLPAGTQERVRFSIPGWRDLGSVIVSRGQVEINIDGAADDPVEAKWMHPEIAEVFTMLDHLDLDVQKFSTIRLPFAPQQKEGLLKKLPQKDASMKQTDRWNIGQDTLASSVANKLCENAETLENSITKINLNLCAKVKQDIRMQTMLAFQKQFIRVFKTCSKSTIQNWIAEWENMMDYCQMNHPESPFSPAFFEVVINNFKIKYKVKGEPIPEGFEKGTEDLFFHYVKENLKGKPQETAMALLFLNDAVSEKYSPAIPPLVKKFKRQYLLSQWKPLIKKAVAKNKAFNSIEFPSYIHFPDMTKIASFKDLIDKYKGKIVLLDIWASWCGPCLESFEYVKPLQEYVKQHDDVVLVYLSCDTQQGNNIWKRIIAHNDLMGDHMLMKESFEQDILNYFGDEQGRLSIPHRAIIDKKGVLRFREASSPEDIEQLTKELEEASK